MLTEKLTKTTQKVITWLGAKGRWSEEALPTLDKIGHTRGKSQHGTETMQEDDYRKACEEMIGAFDSSVFKGEPRKNDVTAASRATTMSARRARLASRTTTVNIL